MRSRGAPSGASSGAACSSPKKSTRLSPNSYFRTSRPPNEQRTLTNPPDQLLSSWLRSWWRAWRHDVIHINRWRCYLWKWGLLVQKFCIKFIIYIKQIFDDKEGPTFPVSPSFYRKRTDEVPSPALLITTKRESTPRWFRQQGILYLGRLLQRRLQGVKQKQTTGQQIFHPKRIELEIFEQEQVHYHLT